MALHPLAGKPAPESILANIPRLVSNYYSLVPDAAEPGHRVAFGTSGHRGCANKHSFNEGQNPATGSHLGRPDIAAVPINTVSMKGTSWPSARPFVNIEPARALTGRCSWASILTHCRSRP